MVTTELGAAGTFHTDWSIVMRQDQPLGPRAFACLEMRTKWMQSWCKGEFDTFTKCIVYHRGQSAYLFSGLGHDDWTHSEKGNKGDGKGRFAKKEAAVRKRQKPGG